MPHPHPESLEHNAPLPDVLRHGLDLVFCGTAPSATSARVGAYYAHGGNLFWDTLHGTGLTPVKLEPGQFWRLLDFNIGLTDLNKRESGVDATLSQGAFDPPGLRQKILTYRPRILAFTSKHGAQLYFGRRGLSYGPQVECIGTTEVWVLPSTSGSARPHWARLKVHWFELGRVVEVLRGRASAFGKIPGFSSADGRT